MHTSSRPWPALLAMLAVAGCLTGTATWAAGCKRAPTVTTAPPPALTPMRSAVRPVGDDDDDVAREPALDDTDDGAQDAIARFSGSDGFPRAAAFDDARAQRGGARAEDAVTSDTAEGDAGVRLDAGTRPRDGELPLDAGVGDDEVLDAGLAPAAVAAAGALEAPAAPVSSVAAAQDASIDPLERRVQAQVRAAIAADGELSPQTRASVYVTTQSRIIELRGEVPSERERALVQDKVEALVGDDVDVTSFLVVRARAVP